MLKIKVCGMLDPVNTGRIAEMSVDYLGFIFYAGSKRYVGLNPDKYLFSSIPGHIIKTGVFADENIERVIDSARIFNLDLIQLHGNETPDYCRALMNEGIKIIKVFKLSGNFDFSICDDFLETCEFFLFDTDAGKGGGTGIKFDWGQLGNYRSGKPFFLSGGIGPGDGASIRRLNHPDLFAVDINSRFEIHPGFKDVTRVEAFIKEIKD